MKSVVYLLVVLIFNQCSAQEPDWERTFLRDAMGRVHIVSSELDEVNPFEGLGNYGGHNLFDKEGSTAWVEGEQGSGIGEYILFGIGKSTPDQMVILNGYQKNKDIFTKNNRVKTIKVSLFVGFMIPMDVTEIGCYYYTKQFPIKEVITIENTYGSQQIAFPFAEKEILQFARFNQQAFLEDFKTELDKMHEDCPTCPTTPSNQFFLKIEIMDVYKGTKWDDTCISDIWFTTAADELTEIPADEKIIEVWEDTHARKIYVNTDARKGIILADGIALEKAENLDEDEHMDITLMDVSPDKEWVQIDYLYTQDGAGRVEEYSTLYSVRYLSMIDEPILGIIYGAFGFIEENGKVYLDTTEDPIDLDKILEEFLKKRNN